MARKYRHFVYDENQRYIYPTSDWGFKYLLGTERNKGLLLGILQELLPELEIETLEYLPQELGLPVGRMKNARFDVYCRQKDGGRIVVEMQNYAYEAFLDRAVVYTSCAVIENFTNSASKNYKIGRTIFVAFVGDPLFKDTDRTPVRLSLCDIDEPATTLRCDNVLQIFVELPKFAGGIRDITDNTPFVEQLAHVLMEMADCDEIPVNITHPLLRRIFEAADIKHMEDNTKENYRSAIMSEADYEYLMDGARKEGLSAGFEEGRAEGREEGRAQGREEGRAEGVQDTARKMKAAAIGVAVISECTGLSPEEVQSL